MQSIREGLKHRKKNWKHKDMQLFSEDAKISDTM